MVSDFVVFGLPLFVVSNRSISKGKPNRGEATVVSQLDMCSNVRCDTQLGQRLWNAFNECQSASATPNANANANANANSNANANA